MLIVDLGYRGREADNTRVLHKGKRKSLTPSEGRRLKRRQSEEPVIGHLKSEHRMRRCYLKVQLEDALNAVLAAVGYNLRWLMRWLLTFCAWILATLLGLEDCGDHQLRLLPV